MDSHCSQFLLGGKAWQVLGSCCAAVITWGSSQDQEVSQSPCKAPDQLQEESQPLLLWSRSTAAYHY